MCSSSPSKAAPVQPIVPQAAPQALASPYDDSSIGLAALRIAGRNGLRGTGSVKTSPGAAAAADSVQPSTPNAATSPQDSPLTISQLISASAGKSASTPASTRGYKTGTSAGSNS